jgi:peptide deformylase
MIHPIVTFGHASLRCESRVVPTVTDEIRRLAADLIDTMHEASGVGLAAPQIGREAAVCVIDIPPDAEKPVCRAFNAAVPSPLVLINPEILATEGSQRNNEGCLSFPEIYAVISRPNQVTVAFHALDASRQTLTVQGLLARAVMHEIDHLNGVLLVDRMSQVQKLAVAGKLRRLKKEAKQA